MKHIFVFFLMVFSNWSAISQCLQTNSSLIEEACQSYTSPSGLIYTTTGTYMDTIMNVAGCDSVITIELQINQPSSVTETVVACDSYTWSNGITYNSSTNSPTDVFVNMAGCDSVVTLNLTINYSTSITFFISGCGQEYIIMGDPANNFFATSDTIVYDTLTAVNGCDSINILDITINESFAFVDSITECASSYLWIDGVTYTSNNNTATAAYLTTNGCDSVITLNLTFIEINDTLIYDNLSSSFSTNQPGANFQWVICSDNYAIIPNLTSSNISISDLMSAGVFNNSEIAAIIEYNGCVDTTNCLPAIWFGIEESDPFSGVKIYPNPSTGLIKINFDGLNPAQLKLSDIAGKTIASEQKITTPEYIISETLPPGIYFLTLLAKNESKTYQLVIE